MVCASNWQPQNLIIKVVVKKNTTPKQEFKNAENEVLNTGNCQNDP